MELAADSEIPVAFLRVDLVVWAEIFTGFIGPWTASKALVVWVAEAVLVGPVVALLGLCF